jgi:protein-tyrosine phosphatase
VDPWQPNFSWITDHLAVGGSFPHEHAEALATIHGIEAVIDLRLETRDDEHVLRRHGITLLHLPTEDTCAVERRHLAHGVRFALRWLEEGRRVLIHCEHGIGRSATLALCVLVSRGAAPLDALALMKDRRALVSPSPVQFDCWVAWLETYRSQHAVSWSNPSFDAFQRIAYRQPRPAA